MQATRAGGVAAADAHPRPHERGRRRALARDTGRAGCRLTSASAATWRIPSGRCERALAALAGLAGHAARRQLAAVPHPALRRGGAARVRQRRRGSAHACAPRRICSPTCVRSSAGSAASRRANAGARASSTSTCWSWAARPARTESLTLPHPGIAERDFVLYPLADIAPDLEVPGLAPRRAAARTRDQPRDRKVVSSGNPEPGATVANPESLPRAIAPEMPAQRYIVVEGPIGVGKTSLARRLAGSLDAELVLEQDAQNPFLERFYKNPEVGRAARAALLPVPARAAARQPQAAGPVRAAPRRGLSIREGPPVRVA